MAPIKIKLDKIDRLILKRVTKDLKGKEVTIQDFKACWLGNLMFYYVDTVGLPERTVFDLVKRIYNA